MLWTTWSTLGLFICIFLVCDFSGACPRQRTRPQPAHPELNAGRRDDGRRHHARPQPGPPDRRAGTLAVDRCCPRAGGRARGRPDRISGRWGSGDLDPGDLPGRTRPARRCQGSRPVRLGLLVDGPLGRAPQQPLVHLLPGRAGGGPAGVPYPDAAARRADGTGHDPVRPELHLQPAVGRRAPPDLLRDVARAARLWLPPQPAEIAAGAFFGLSTMMTWNAWYEIQGALGAIFLPLALEAAVRLRRGRGWRQATILGVVLGAALLTDQESAIMAGFVAIVAVLPWLIGRPADGGLVAWDRLRSAALAAVVTVVGASPPLIAIVQQTHDATVPQRVLASDYLQSGANLQQIFAPSPRVAFFGLTALAQDYWHSGDSLTFTAYGTVLTLLALFGLAVWWGGAMAGG